MNSISVALVVLFTQSLKELLLGQFFDGHVDPGTLQLAFHLERHAFGQGVRRNETSELNSVVWLRAGHGSAPRSRLCGSNAGFGRLFCNAQCWGQTIPTEATP